MLRIIFRNAPIEESDEDKPGVILDYDAEGNGVGLEVSYAKPGHFRKRMHGRGNAPRDWLRAFMRHWLAGLLGTERPDLYECLPDTYALGQALPAPVWPRRRWHGNGQPLHPPRDWNPRLVLQHRRWRWLAKRLPASTAAERTTGYTAVTATNRQIDALVHELYGLTADSAAPARMA